MTRRKSQLTTLLGARLRAARNRFAHRSPRWWGGIAAGTLVVLAALVGAGHAAAPALMAPPLDLATPRGLLPEQLPAGTGAVEAAFWLTALVASVLTFRVMEILFRRRDIQTVEVFPITQPVLFVDRALATSVEAVGAGLAMSLFFLPLAWHGGAAVWLVCTLLLVLGLLTGSLASLAVMLVSAASMVPEAGDGRGDADRPRVAVDMYGGSGQVFLFAPGVALGIAVVLILFLKLVLGELLRVGPGPGRAFTMGLGVVATIAVASVVVAYRSFTRGFHAMAARFREADLASFTSATQYQTSSFGARRAAERLLRPTAAAVYRAEILQYGRRYMLSRYLYGLGWLAMALALWSLSAEAFPFWAQALVPTIVLGLMANPWRRLALATREPTAHHGLPIGRSDVVAASTLFAAREALLVSVPFAAAIVLVRGALQGLWPDALWAAAAAVLAGLAINGVVALLDRMLGRLSGRVALATLTPALAAAALLATGVASLPLLVLVCAVLLLLQASPWISYDTRSVLR